MKKAPALLLLLLLPFYALTQFVCPPCAQSCDTLSFTEAGICPHCQMALIPAPPFLFTEDSLLRSIYQEVTDNSQTRKVISYLGDVYGPRLMATENYFQAIQWTQRILKEWQADTVSLHSFDRAHRGWELQSFSVEMTEPSYSKIWAYPAAYTSATPGEVEAEVIYLDRLDSLDRYRGKLKGKVVLLGDNYRPVSSRYAPMATTFSEEQLQAAADNPDPNHRVLGYLSRRSINQAIEQSEKRRVDLEAFFTFVQSEGAVALVEPSDYPYGILHVDGNRHFPTYIHEGDLRPVPSFVFSNEHFGRLKRLLDLGIAPRLKFHLDAEFTNRPEYNKNLLAEIRGRSEQLKEESVIIGGHFDSWHGGTGAVDNASGVAIMMEAFRVLKALDLPMKRTVKLALWGGEEQIFAGSFGYVDDFVGNIDNGALKAEASKISAYFNLDNGCGKIRGIYTMGNAAVLPIFSEALQPFEGDNTLTLQYTNQTDHELFDRLNIPAFQFIQDPLDYMSAIHHTNVDLLEYVRFEDLDASAMMVAYLVYQIANREEMLPRKAHNSPAPSRQGNTTFTLAAHPEAEQVQLIGSFNNWNLFGTPMYRTADGWECKLDLAAGDYWYKFYIDGDFVVDPKTPEAELQNDGNGHSGLTLLRVSDQ